MQIHNNVWPDFYQTTLYTDCIITPIAYMHTQHYACVDVLPEDSLAWMSYFTHHKHTGGHHYTCIDVL
jgi:hypothetical protein